MGQNYKRERKANREVGAKRWVKDTWTETTILPEPKRKYHAGYYAQHRRTGKSVDDYEDSWLHRY